MSVGMRWDLLSYLSTTQNLLVLQSIPNLYLSPTFDSKCYTVTFYNKVLKVSNVDCSNYTSL